MLRFSGSGEEANRSNSYLHLPLFTHQESHSHQVHTPTIYAVPFDLYQFISAHFPLSHTITPPSTIILSITPSLLFVSPPLFSLFHHPSSLCFTTPLFSLFHHPLISLFHHLSSLCFTTPSSLCFTTPSSLCFTTPPST